MARSRSSRQRRCFASRFDSQRYRTAERHMATRLLHLLRGNPEEADGMVFPATAGAGPFRLV
jgi:hypothetical protein